MPGGRDLHLLFFFLLFLLLVWCFKDFIAALGIVYLFIRLFFDETMHQQQKVEPSSYMDQVRRLFGWPDQELHHPDYNYRHPQTEVQSSNGSSRSSNVERRPLLYESRVTPRRRHTETDIHLPPELLTPDNKEPESFSPDTLRGLLNSSSYHSLSTAIHGCEQQTGQIPGNDAPRTSELNHMASLYSYNYGDDMEVYSDSNQDYTADSDDIYDIDDHSNNSDDNDDDDDVDEFFLATDFADPLPKANYSQSTSCLHDLISEQQNHLTDFKQR